MNQRGRNQRGHGRNSRSSTPSYNRESQDYYEGSSQRRGGSYPESWGSNQGGRNNEFGGNDRFGGSYEGERYRDNQSSNYPNYGSSGYGRSSGESFEERPRERYGRRGSYYDENQYSQNQHSQNQHSQNQGESSRYGRGSQRDWDYDEDQGRGMRRHRDQDEDRY